MLDANHMVIVNEDGEEIEVEVLLTFEPDDSNKRFVLIVDPENEDNVFPFIYTENGELEEVSDPEELDMCAEVLNTFYAEETGDES